jgi:hypothetical protein
MSIVNKLYPFTFVHNALMIDILSSIDNGREY